MMALAGLVGVITGVAAGVFSNFIAFFQTLFFRPGMLFRAVTHQDPAWTARFQQGLLSAHWHWEYLFAAVIGVAISRVIAELSKRQSLRFSLPDLGGRIRAVGWLLGFGLILYYPLVVLTEFNGAFTPHHGGLFASLLEMPWEWRIAAPALGGLFAALLVTYVTPESGGHGVTEVIETIHSGNKRIPPKVSFWKSITAGLVIGSGGSAGREGPVVQIGGAVASGLAERFGLSRERAVLLLACGGGAGIAASFNSPIGGTLFALEIILGDFGTRSIAPVAFAAVAATVTGRTISGAGGEIVHVPFSLVSSLEIGPYLLLGVLSALVSVAYVRSITGMERLFHEGPLRIVPVPLRPMLGGLVLGLLGLIAPRVLGNGYETMNAALLGQLSAATLMAVLLAKIIANALTLGSGAPGGSFFPAVFLGAMAGGWFGHVGQHFFPHLVAAPTAYAAVGMAAVVAGATNAPLTAIMMLFELTGSYDIILPLMVACTTSVAGARWALGGSMYSLKLRERGIVLRSDRRNALRERTVGSAMTPDVTTLPASASLETIMSLVRATTHSAFPVVDEKRRLIGVVLLEDLRPYLGDDALPAVVLASDVCRPHPPVCTPEETLETARARMSDSGFSHLPVVESVESRTIAGIISHRDILIAFEAAGRAQ
jgi:CIC family chloride channel protein